MMGLAVSVVFLHPADVLVQVFIGQPAQKMNDISQAVGRASACGVSLRATPKKRSHLREHTQPTAWPSLGNA